MAIISSAFRAVELSGEDAKKFHRQVTYGRPKKAAFDAAKKGALMVDEMSCRGSVSITLAQHPKGE